jgi:hypothetical protein
MIKPAPTRHSGPGAKVHLSLGLNESLGSLRKSVIITATLKRRALKKKFLKPDKNAGKGGAFPAVDVVQAE